MHGIRITMQNAKTKHPVLLFYKDELRAPASNEDCDCNPDPLLWLPTARLSERQSRMDSWAAESKTRCTKTTTSEPGDRAGSIPASSMPSSFPSSLPGGAAPVPTELSDVVLEGEAQRRLDREPLTVWTDLPYLSDAETGLTRAEFRVSESGCEGSLTPEKADVVWASVSVNKILKRGMR